MAMETLNDLFAHELKDLYSAETQITKALPKVINAVQSPELRAALEAHLKETEEHVNRIEKIAADLDVSPRGHKCVGMEGLLQEGSDLLKEKAQPWVLDAGLIGGCQRVEHYEIAAYGTAREHAEKLGLYQVAQTLQKTLNEEEAADKKLSGIAENAVNAMAAM